LPVKPPIVKARIRKVEECRFAARIRGMAGLRNILVHDYLEVDPAELRKHLGRLKDFERYCRCVVEYLEL
jgi:uncharacterized protein YutE (UPF0331/DUF86 family)